MLIKKEETMAGIRSNIYNRMIWIIALSLSVVLMCGISSFAEEETVSITDSGGDYSEYSMDVADLSAEALEENESAEEALSKRLLIVGSDDLDLTALEGAYNIVSSGDGLYVVQFDTKSDANRAYKALRKWDTVDSVEYDDTVESESLKASIFAAAASSSGHLSWGADCIGTDSYSSRIAYGSGRSVTVAVVDSGVDRNHPFLSSRVSGGYNLVDKTSNPKDLNGHGTHVAGIIADCTLGRNEISIMPVRVLDKDGVGNISTVGSGLLYACDNGADIINLSVGGPHSAYLDSIVKRVINRKVILVTASGNEACDIDYIGSCPSHIEEAITVGAIDKSFRVDQYSNYGKKLDFVAPGTAVRSAFLNSGYATYSGTSMASPHVAASVALLELHYGSLSNREVESLLKRSCRKYSDTYRYGNGVINLKNLAASIANQNIELSSKSYEYSGKDKKPSIKVSRNGQNLFKGRDYSVTYLNTKSVGTAYAIVKGKGTYNGVKKISYVIKPRGTAISKISPKKKGFKVAWKKQKIQTSGYEIQYSLKSNFKSAKTVEIKGNNASSKTVKKLQRHKKYFVRIRTYKTVNGKKYCSKWSSKFRVVTK